MTTESKLTEENRALIERDGGFLHFAQSATSEVVTMRPQALDRLLDAARTEGRAEGSAERERLRSLFDWLRDHPNCELSFAYGEEGEWQVHRITGGWNDREWEVIGSGAAPEEALLQALEASQ